MPGLQTFRQKDIFSFTKFGHTFIEPSPTGQTPCLRSYTAYEPSSRFLATWPVRQRKHNTMYTLAEEPKPNMSSQLSQIAGV